MKSHVLMNLRKDMTKTRINSGICFLEEDKCVLRPLIEAEKLQCVRRGTEVVITWSLRWRWNLLQVHICRILETAFDLLDHVC